MHRRDGGDVTYLVDELGLVLGAVTFLIFGAVLLGPALGNLTWQIAVVAVLSLTLVRMAPVAVAMLGTEARWPTVGFLGWFGPRGLASIVFAALIVEQADLPHTDTLLVTIFATIGLSVFAHGISARPLTDRYATWYEAHPRVPDGACRGPHGSVAPRSRRSRTTSDREPGGGGA